MVLDFCSQVEDGVTPTSRQTTKDGNFGILNFLWYAGPGVVYKNTAGTRHHFLQYLISRSGS